MSRKHSLLFIWSTRVVLCVATIILMTLLLESVAWLVLTARATPVTIGPEYNLNNDIDLGYALKPAATWEAKKTLENGTVVYDVVYHTDALGRRDWIRPMDGDRHIIFFGDSFTFGEGLADTATLPAQVALRMQSYAVYNYAVSGYGPSHVLALLTSRDVCAEVPQRSGIAIFAMIPSHIDRVAGDTRASWSYESPYYAIENGRPVRHGSFLTGRSSTTRFYQGFLWLKSHSYVLKALDVHLPLFRSRAELDATADVLSAARDAYESQCNGTFVVALHPDWYRLADKSLVIVMRQKLLDRNMTVFDYSSFPFVDEYVIPYEHHPTGELNDALASMMILDIARVESKV